MTKSLEKIRIIWQHSCEISPHLKMPQWTSNLFLNNPSADTNFGGPLKESVLISSGAWEETECALVSAAACSECIVGKTEDKRGREHRWWDNTSHLWLMLSPSPPALSTREVCCVAIHQCVDRGGGGGSLVPACVICRKLDSPETKPFCHTQC